jgi:hypothetical protein
MKIAWDSNKSTAAIAAMIGLGFLLVAGLDAQYRYFHVVVAILAFCYAYRKLRVHETPFEKHERELRRNFR